MNIINDSDINKYLSIIKNTEASRVTSTTINPSTHQTALGRVFIDPTCDVRGIERMRIGSGVVIQRDCWLNIAFSNPTPGPMIVINEGTNIGRRCTISAANKITIGKNVLVAPNVLITDHNHEYRNISTPIMQQGITTYKDRVSIGDETWIGTNAVIVGNVAIGKHCIIGANSVLNINIPDFSVAAGNPAKVVKIFDIKTNQWVKIECKADLDNYLADRGKKPS